MCENKKMYQDKRTSVKMSETSVSELTEQEKEMLLVVSEMQRQSVLAYKNGLISHFADWQLSVAPFQDDEESDINKVIYETIENAISGAEEIAEVIMTQISERMEQIKALQTKEM